MRERNEGGTTKKKVNVKEAGNIAEWRERKERKKTRLSTSSPGLVLSLLTKCRILFLYTVCS